MAPTEGSLPAGGPVPWPPKDMTPAYSRYGMYSAWYGGDPDILSAVYAGTNADWRDPSGPFSTGAETRTGVLGAVGRAIQNWFWGRRPTPGERRSKLHIPVASDIATMSADLLFAEPPRFTVENPATQDRLNDIFDETCIDAVLLEGAEVGAALGDTYLCVTWDTTFADHPFLRTVHADAAVPEFKWGRLSAVTFWQTVAVDGTNVWRHLERHEDGLILNGLYKGKLNELGWPHPLEAQPATADLQPVVNAIPGMLTAAHIPNMRPNRLDRTSSLGRSDFSPGVLGLMDALDECWSSWMRDLRLGKARIIAPQEMLRDLGPGQGAVFEQDREVYSGLNMLQRPGDPNPLTLSQFAIRVQEHQETAHNLLEQILRGAGYSAQSFGAAGDTAVTATEVHARERMSFITRDKKTRYWMAELPRLVETLLAVDATYFGSKVLPERPVVEFGDTVQEQPEVTARTAQLLRQAEAASTETLVKLVNPDWDADQVREEVRLIQSESSMAVPSPDQFMRGSDVPPADPNADPNVDPNAAPANNQNDAETYPPAG